MLAKLRECGSGTWLSRPAATRCATSAEVRPVMAAAAVVARSVLRGAVLVGSVLIGCVLMGSGLIGFRCRRAGSPADAG